MPAAFKIQYAMEAAEDIRGLRAFDRRKILDAIVQHLVMSPTQLSRSRIKKMVQPFWSQYRLRVDDFRVYYDIDEVQQLVAVLRVLRKGSETTPESL